jgi:hypothetical protein
MSESFIQNLFASRIGGAQYGKSTAIYKFEKIKRAKRAALAANTGGDIIDMGVGEPDDMAYPEVIEVLHREAKNPGNRGYADNGDAVLKEAAARYLDHVCGAPGINPETGVLHSIGSKAALSILPMVAGTARQRTIQRQASQAIASMNGSSRATAAVSPSAGASARTRRVPSAKPAAKTTAK